MTAKFTFWPVRTFQHQKGRFLCRADQGNELERRDCVWYVVVKKTRYLIATKMLESHNKIYNSKLIYIKATQGV